MAHRILLVDDDADYLFVITSLLQNAGYEIVTAGNGAEAMAAFKESLENALSFSLILLDVRLPDTNGFAVLKELRKVEEEARTPEDMCVPVILFTAYNDPFIDVSSFRGRNDFLLKSIGTQELLNVIKVRLKKNF